MLANAGGPAWQMHLLPQQLDKLPYVGTIAMLFAASNLIKVPGFATLGFVTRENMLIGLALVPIAVVVQLRRHLAGAAHLERDVLPHRLCADVPYRGRIDAQLDAGVVVELVRVPSPSIAPAICAKRVVRRRFLRFNHPPP